MSAGISIPPELADPDRWQDSRHWLAAQRKRLGIGQRLIAKQMGVSQGRVSELEGGHYKAPRAETIARYLRALQELAASVEVPAEDEAPAPPPRRRRTVGTNMLVMELKTKALELLGDGEWHNYESVLREIGKLVPPGLALRRAESERMKGGRRGTERKQALLVERQIEIGRRSFARSLLRGDPRVETDTPGEANHRLPQRRVRLVRR